jgi:hypothetical protein
MSCTYVDASIIRLSTVFGKVLCQGGGREGDDEGEDVGELHRFVMVWVRLGSGVVVFSL